MLSCTIHRRLSSSMSSSNYCTATPPKLLIHPAWTRFAARRTTGCVLPSLSTFNGLIIFDRPCSCNLTWDLVGFESVRAETAHRCPYILRKSGPSSSPCKLSTWSGSPGILVPLISLAFVVAGRCTDVNIIQLLGAKSAGMCAAPSSGSFGW